MSAQPGAWQVKVGWGVGAGLAVLVSLVLYSFGLFGALVTLQSVGLLLSTIFLLVGLWTLVAAFVVVEAKDRTYYAAWGVVIAFVSLFAYVPATYAIGILLIALIVLILLVLYTGKTQEAFTAATTPPAASGGSPAARAM
jgi:hypothetical protein